VGKIRKHVVLYRVRSPVVAPTELFTQEEQTALEPYFGNANSPVFVLTNLPEVVKGALFARYSRSAKSVRRLFLDEFLGTVTDVGKKHDRRGPGEDRAERLYSRVFNEYGDDSVSQLGGAHIACEGISNVLTKILERGRLMAYLEQSTRYVPYTDRPNNQWKYVIPSEITSEADYSNFKTTLDRAFEIYTKWIESAQQYFRERHPQTTGDPDSVYKAVIRAKALDTLRGLLPAATRSNVGVYGSGQAYEALLLKMQGHPLSEVREVATLMLPELRKVIPAFLQRVDRENRGVRWSNYLANCERATRELTGRLTTSSSEEKNEEVTLSDFDPDGEIKVVAAALYTGSNLSHSQLLRIARTMSTADRIQVLRTYVGNRHNRRHRPGRAFEHATYAFDVLSDYGAFRDLQRHRILTIDWQDLSTLHGHTRPEAVEDIGALSDWNRVMDEASDLCKLLTDRYTSLTAQYAVSMAYRIRFYMKMNAREAMHVIELRTAPQGHPAYRRVCQKMHRLIADQAGHNAIAEAMSFVDHSEVELERLESERANARRRTISKESAGNS